MPVKRLSINSIAPFLNPSELTADRAIPIPRDKAGVVTDGRLLLVKTSSCKSLHTIVFSRSSDERPRHPSPLIVAQLKAIYIAMGLCVLWDSEGEAVNPEIGI